ncbi:MAG: tetratricopeptide repeat protein [Haliscomenobacter sp.]|uniref:tetratricopeptide repeat-containing sensor histidine kinase n=1 Tax=Haliscomenobacter sp. TaxID=2717303 RepID=UPI0029B9B596|nr:tetratricopeptide repeat protein [Haliscomenobacter sp.]MDX2066873.1 tetratricopeptide repeat protein [Haliscomenobacter sp.]
MSLYSIYLLVLTSGLILFCVEASGQLTPFDPQKRADLEARLNQVEIKAERAKVLLDLHDQLMYSEPIQAYTYNDQALNLAKALRNNVLLSRAYGNKGNQSFDVGNLDQALQYYRKASNLIKIEEHPLLAALHYSNMANVLALKGDYATSMEYSYTSIDLCKKHPAGLNLKCHTRANLAESYTNLQQFEKAEFLLQLNLKELHSISSPTVLAMTLNNLGIVYQKKEQPIQAIDYLQQAIQESDPIGLHYFTSGICANLSELYLGEQEPQKALPFARRARQMSIQHRDAQVQAVSSRNLAKIFLALNQLDSAKYYAQYALNITIYKGIQSLRPSVLSTYAQVLKQLKQYDASLKALQEARLLNDSIFSEDLKIESTQRLEAFSMLEAQQSMDHFYADRINRAKLIRWITGIAIVLAFLIGIGIYSLYQQRKLVNRILTKKMATIEAQRKELFNLNLVKDQLFSAIATELRTPLSTIQGVLANLGQGANWGHQNQEILLGQLQQQTMRTINLLEDLMFTARVQMQQYQPLRQEFQLKPLAGDLDKNIRLLSNGSYSPILYHIPPDLNLYSDPTMLKMILRNLLLIVAERPGKKDMPVTLSAWREGDRVNIRIADVEEVEHRPDHSSHAASNPKPYWDLRLIRTFVEGFGGELKECPEGKGYDLVLLDAQGA